MELEPEINSDRYLIRALSTALVKVSFFICSTIVVGILLSKCQLDNEIITACQKSCALDGAHMKSVTSGKCICADPDNNDDIWILPKE